MFCFLFLGTHSAALASCGTRVPSKHSQHIDLDDEALNHCLPTRQITVIPGFFFYPLYLLVFGVIYNRAAVFYKKKRRPAKVWTKYLRFLVKAVFPCRMVYSPRTYVGLDSYRPTDPE